jgi:hypothetical protein
MVDLGLAFIDLKLQLLGDLADPNQCLCGSGFTADHKIIGKIDDVCLPATSSLGKCA